MSEHPPGRTTLAASRAGADNPCVRAHRRLWTVLAVATMLALGTAVARSLGYKVGGTTIVRCRDGHLFTTLWIPGVSVKALRLGWWRYQRCPVGHHWTFVSPVRDADLTAEQRAAAEQLHDVHLP